MLINKGEDSKDGSATNNRKGNSSNKDLHSANDLKSGESVDSPMRRNVMDYKFSDPHMQSKLSTHSIRTGVSRITSSKNLNQYGFGNSFYQKYQTQLKGKKSPKFILKYLQVQVNDVWAKMMECLNMNDLIRTDMQVTKEKLYEWIEHNEAMQVKFDNISSSYEHMDDDYKHVIKYYDFSKTQHEDILKHLSATENTLKQNEGKMKNFIDTQKSEIEDKRNRIVNLEADFRHLKLDVRFIKEQKQKNWQGIMQQLENFKKFNSDRDGKLDDVIREMSNIDFKQNTQNEYITSEIFQIKQPLQDQMINMQKENEVLLRELNRTQKDHRSMLSEFYGALNKEIDETDLKSQVLSKTGDILRSNDSFSINRKRDCWNQGVRPSTTTHHFRNKSRAVTQHGTRFDSFNKNLEIRDPNSKQPNKNSLHKKRRLMTSKPKRPQST